MTNGSPVRLIFLFALPLILGSLGQQLYMIVDTVIVGKGVGVEALAALGATDWIIWMILWSVQALTQGFGILLSQRFGAGDYCGLRQVLAMAVLLCAAIAAALTAASLIAARPLLSLLQTPDSIFGGALSYLYTICAGTVIVSAYNMAAAVLRSFGDGKSPLIAMGIAACVNIALDILFVMGFGWGIVGAGIATLIAQFISFLYCLRVLRSLSFIRLDSDSWKPHAGCIRELCRLGVPLALQSVLIAVGGMILQRVINRYGVVLVAGFTATNKIYGVLECAAIAFGYAMTTYMAQNYGACKAVRIRRGLKSGVLLSAAVSAGISLVMLLVGKRLLSMFVPESDVSAAAVIQTAWQYLATMSVCLFILYLLHTYRSALQGLGNTAAPFVSGCIEFVMRVSIALVFPSFFGAQGLFLAEPGAWTGAAVFLCVSYYRHEKKVMRELERAAA